MKFQAGDIVLDDDGEYQLVTSYDPQDNDYLCLQVDTSYGFSSTNSCNRERDWYPEDNLTFVRHSSLSARTQPSTHKKEIAYEIVKNMSGAISPDEVIQMIDVIEEATNTVIQREMNNE